MNIFEDTDVEYKYIVHISDIHIRNNERRKEYEAVFKKLIESLSKIEENFIIAITGDIVHSKTELSPEALYLSRELFKSLSKLAKIIVIAGNHDCVLYNNTRLSILDSIKDIKNVTYADVSGHYIFGNIAFGVTSIKDTKVTPPYNDDNLYDVGMYHGYIATNKEDPGHRFAKCYTLNEFKGYNYVLLGDIHKHYYLNGKKTVAYAGSLIQQNYSETLENHGYILWDLEDSTSSYVEIKNNFGFYTMNLSDDIDDNLPKNLNIRFITKSDVYSNKLVDKKLSEIEKKYNIISVSRKDSEIQTDNIIIKTDLEKTDITSYFVKYMEEKNIANKDKILELHETIVKNKVVDLCSNNSHVWIPLELEFSNMFSYLKENKIDFSKYNKNTITGIIAPNYSGKSSIIDVLLFCLYGKCPRGDHKQIMNNKEKFMTCSLKFIANKDIYVIKRESNKRTSDVYLRKINKNKEEYLNEGNKQETEKKIKDLVGSYESVLSSIVWIPDILDDYNFITKTPQKKKEYLNNLFGIDKLLEYNKYAKDNLNELRIKLSIMKEISSTTDISKKISDAKNILELNKLKQSNLEDLTNIIIPNKKNYTLFTIYPDVNTEVTSNSLTKIQNDLQNKLKEMNDLCIEDLENEVRNISSRLEKELENVNNLEKEKNVINENIKLLRNNLEDIDENIFENINTLNLKELDYKINELKKIITDLNPQINDSLNVDKNLESNIRSLRKKKEELQKKLIKLLELPKLKTDISKYEKYINISESDILEKKITIKNYIEFEKILKKYNVPFSYQETIDDIETFLSNQKTVQFTEKDKKDYYLYIQNDKFNSDSKNINNKLNEEITNIADEIKNKEYLLQQINTQMRNISKLDKTKSELELSETNKKLLLKYQGSIEKNKKIKKEITDTKIELENQNKKISKLNTVIANLKTEKKNLENKLEQIQKNNLEKNKVLDKLQKIEIVLGPVLLNEYILSQECPVQKIRSKILNLEKDKIRLEGNLNNLLKENEEILANSKKRDELESEIELYDTYFKLTKQEALPFSIIREYIPIIQKNVNIFLESITDFTITIDNDTNMEKIEILINRINNNVYNCRTSSGFENFIISLAFRLVFHKLSMEPKPNILIMDEKWTSIDPDKLTNVLGILDSLKSRFASIIIISHMDQVKSKCDNIINIDKSNGISKIL